MRFKASEALLGIETSHLTAVPQSLGRFKASEALLGIETVQATPKRACRGIQSLWSPFRDWYPLSISSICNCRVKGFKASEALLGIETAQLHNARVRKYWFKASEALLGIETKNKLFYLIELIRFKASEALLGIETADLMARGSIWGDSKPLKPF